MRTRGVDFRLLQAYNAFIASLYERKFSMSIKNEAKIKNPLIVAIREQLEHRA